MRTNKLPFLSVVINTLNGQKTIARTLDSVLLQDYPKRHFEIIVVNDGSTDDTADIVARYKTVRLINLPHNMGISEARNHGLAAARGDIYVALDDDCIVAPNWLSELAKGYALDKPAGVGGYLLVSEPRGLVSHYISAVGSGFAPVSSNDDAPKSIFRRFFAYLRAGLHRLDESDAPHVTVQELYGANSSFPVDILRAVGGWRTDMWWVEDRDLSLRIRERYPDYHFYAMKNAAIVHDPYISTGRYLLRPYRRGPANLRFHRVNKLVPPIFPFPIVMLLIFSLAFFVTPDWKPLLVGLIAPQFLYFWWPYYGLLHRRAVYLVFPYLQLAEETMVIIGLLRGYITHLKEVYADR
ncbi:MAG TPA: glycosyltransferase family 2 protein [Candidatus Saccharimonadales bacterium]|nr:glycosyltransferase family 2 protein [Candidatus Saccharimonadales bacterium]